MVLKAVAAVHTGTNKDHTICYVDYNLFHNKNTSITPHGRDIALYQVLFRGPRTTAETQPLGTFVTSNTKQNRMSGCFKIWATHFGSLWHHHQASPGPVVAVYTL
jgi:hypothetical protein